MVHGLAQRARRQSARPRTLTSSRLDALARTVALGGLLVAGTTSTPREARGQEQPPKDQAPGQHLGQQTEQHTEQHTVPAAETTSSLVDVELAVELPLTLAAGLLAGSLALLKDELVQDRCWPHCDQSALNALDRPFAGRFDQTAAVAGDVLVGVNLALPHLFGLLDLATAEQPEGAVGFGEDTLILAETLALTALTHQLVAFAAQRPRPFTHGERAGEERLAGANAYLSFYSGHTANSFAMATAYATLYGLRHPRSRWRGALWALLPGLAAMEGGLRVLSGYHYPTDVLVGGAVGSAIGLIVPWLHTASAATQDGASSSVGPGVALIPMVGPGLAGLSLAIH